MRKILSMILVGGLLLSPWTSVTVVAQTTPTRPLSTVKTSNPYSDDVVRIAKALQQQYREFYRLVALWPRNVPEVMTKFQQYHGTYRRYWRAVSLYQQEELAGRSFAGVVVGIQPGPVMDSTARAVKGKVPTDRPQPLPRVQISVSTEPKGPRALPEIVAMEVTDAKGRFVIPKLKQGVKYRYSLVSGGYRPLEGSFTMGSTSIRRKFTMELVTRGIVKGRVLALDPELGSLALDVLEDRAKLDRTTTADLEKALGDAPRARPGEAAPDRELHVVAAYCGTVPADQPRLPMPGNDPGFITVKVKKTGKPMTLCLSTYDPCTWTLDIENGAKIEQLVLVGYHAQTVKGLPRGVPVQRRVFEENPDEWFYLSHDQGRGPVYPGDTENRERREFLESIAKLEALAGTSVTSYQGIYTGESFEVPGRFDGATTPLAGVPVRLLPVQRPDSEPGPSGAPARLAPFEPADYSVFTDEAGRFSFEDLPEGEYIVQVEAPGYLPYEDRVSTKFAPDVPVLLVPASLPPPPPVDDAPVVSEAATVTDDLNNPFAQAQD